eukprot:COSAG02_NODE_899_length_16096_cov_19.762956_9_plen_46_part_01
MKHTPYLHGTVPPRQPDYDHIAQWKKSFSHDSAKYYVILLIQYMYS